MSSNRKKPLVYQHRPELSLTLCILFWLMPTESCAVQCTHCSKYRVVHKKWNIFRQTAANFPNDITGAQNFNFAPKFPQDDIF